jgi:hypothetical protein
MSEGMPIRLLIAVFSHERFVGLRNLLNSIRRFVPAADIYVFDDASRDSRIPGLLTAEQAKGGLRWDSGLSDSRSQRLGSLYENLNRALERSIDEKYDLLLLLQDDHQILWFDDTILTDVVEFFGKVEDGLVLDPRFIRYSSYSARFADRSQLAQVIPRGSYPLGFLSPKKVAKIGFRFADSERASSERALQLGMSVYQLLRPFLAEIPVMMRFCLRPPLFRGKQWLDEHLADPPDRPILKPLSGREVRLIKACPADRGILAEDFVQRNDVDSFLVPHYHHGASLDRYREVTLSSWLRLIASPALRARFLPERPSQIVPRSASAASMLWRNRYPMIGRIMLLWESIKTAAFLLLVYPLIRYSTLRNSRRFRKILDSQAKIS